jgi:hypothetical protein
MEMTEATVSADYSLIRQYLVRVSAGLKQIDELQKKEILAEIDSHLRERIEELRAGGDPHPVERAISGLGEAAALASEFVVEAQTKSGIHGYAPWTLLRKAARLARNPCHPRPASGQGRPAYLSNAPLGPLAFWHFGVDFPSFRVQPLLDRATPSLGGGKVGRFDLCNGQQRSIRTISSGCALG